MKAAFLRVILPGDVGGAVAVGSKPGRGTLLAIFALGLAVALVGLKFAPALIRRIGSREDRRLEERRDRLLETLSAFGHGKTATANLDRLSLLFKNMNEELARSPEFRKKVAETIETCFDFTSPRLAEIVRRAEQAKVAEDRVEAIGNNLKRLTGLLQNYREGAAAGKEIEALSREIPERLRSIEEAIQAVRSKLARFYRCDVIHGIEDVLAAMADGMAKEGVRLGSVTIEGDVRAKGFVRESDFSTIIEELLNNAVRAMRESPEKRVDIAVRIEESRILVEVTDTGCGIEAEAAGGIFAREYTTKKEGGYGLYHARMTLDRYGGRIRVARSEPGKGTTLRLEVKRA